LRLARGAAAIATRADAETAIRDPDEALVSWVVTDTRTFAFVTTRDEGRARTTLHVVPVARGDLAARIEAFRRDVASRALTTAASGAALHAVLLGPLQPRLSGRTRLVIAPDGALWELPWAALQPSRGRYLLEDVAITLVPSVTAWRAIAARPATGSAGPSVVALAQGRAVAGLGALPEARQQAADLRRLYAAWQVSVFDGPLVSEDTWRDHVAGHRIVHVAAHGVVDSTSPMSSALILGPPRGSSDGRLEARELLDVPLDADLVVLAACETARGRVSAGEGMIGLTWAALVAGARNVVVSQWKVDAASTTEMMRAFHARVAHDWAADPVSAPAADEALRGAALALMRRAPTRHPFYWAGVVLIGDGTLTPASRPIAP
jgi:CHAT domain-containing protein